MRTLSATAERLLDDLPPYMRNDPHVQAYIVALANESDRVMEMLAALEYGLLPHNAGASFNRLSLWERLLGLPVAPAGVSEPQRVTKVVAFFRSRRAAKASEWVGLISTALGTTDWEHEEGPGTYQVTVHFPYVAEGYTIQTVEQFARTITPAHLQVSATYAGSFIVGEDDSDPDAGIVGEDIL